MLATEVSAIPRLELGILDVRAFDCAIECKRGPIEIIGRNRRAKVGANVQAAIGGERERHRYWNLTLRHHDAVCAKRHVERTPGPWGTRMCRSNLDLGLAN